MSYNKRIKQVQQYLKDESLDGFLVLTETNREYLSGFTGSKGYLVVTKRTAKLYVDDRYTLRAKKESDLPVKHTRELKLKGRIGMEDEITLHQMNKLKEKHGGVKWQVTRRVVDYIRAEKNPKELKQIKKGGEIIDQTFEHVKKLVRKKYQKGIRETEIAEEIEKYGKKLGAEDLAFEPIVASGPHAAAPHHKSSSDSKIKKNTFLLLDFGFVVNGYNSDFTRTLFIGRPTKKHEEVYNTVLQAQLEEIETIKPEIKAHEVDRAGRGIIAKAGYGKYFTHCSGHGVGLELHEAPNLCPDMDEILPENCVVTVEPGIYFEGKWGVRIEDMVWVREKGPEVLTKSGKEFKSMVIN